MTTTSTAHSALGQADSVTTLLQEDHERLDAIIEAARGAAASGAFADARARFSEASAGLGLHIDAEEQVLFPAFEEATGMRGGPTNVMRMEHVDLRSLLERITSALDGSDGSAAAAGFDELTRLLGVHNNKEEQILYPMIDRSMAGDPLVALVGAVRAAIEPKA